ncbi:hypothetical protein ZWY2020_054664 [Hordeum vulgare]|nr:hypothetical protein ZWY2020_054664 [Hordeum vulgare]
MMSTEEATDTGKEGSPEALAAARAGFRGLLPPRARWLPRTPQVLPFAGALAAQGAACAGLRMYAGCSELASVAHIHTRASSASQPAHCEAPGARARMWLPELPRARASAAAGESGCCLHDGWPPPTYPPPPPMSYGVPSTRRCQEDGRQMDGGQSPRPQQHHRTPEREGNNNYDIERMDGAREGERWQNGSSDALLRYDDRRSVHEPLMRKRTINTASQIAIVGANICPIESLDYEVVENNLFKQDWRSRKKKQIFQYIVMKWTLVFYCIFGDGGSNLVLAAAAAAICAYIAPAAAGSGIPEVKAYLNGVDAYSILAPSTLFVKIFGSILGVSAGFVLGKEGPMVAAFLWRAFFTTAVVAVKLRTLIEFCRSGKCGLFGQASRTPLAVWRHSRSGHELRRQRRWPEWLRKAHFVLVPMMAQAIPSHDRHGTPAGRAWRAARRAPFPAAEFGPPDGCENLDMIQSKNLFLNFVEACAALQEPLMAYLRQQQRSPPSCIISDVMHWWTGDIARELGIPRLTFIGFCGFSSLVRYIIFHNNVLEHATDENELITIPGFPTL